VCPADGKRRRRTDLADIAVEHQCDARGERKRLLLIVRDDDAGKTQPSLQVLQFDLHLVTELAVERAERLVKQQNVRLHHDGARERDTLALATGQRVGVAFAKRREPNHRERLRDLGGDVRLGHAAPNQTVRDVLGNGHVGEERIVLKYETDVALVRRAIGHVLPPDPYLPGVRPHETCDRAQRRRLAATGRTEQRDALAVLHREAQSRNDTNAAVRHPDIVEFETSHDRASSGESRVR